MGAKGQDESQEFNPKAGKEKDVPGRARREERQGSKANDPSGREHQERKNFHGRNAKDYAAAGCQSSTLGRSAPSVN